MRVLLLHDYARLAGGAEIETEHLRRGLASRGVDVAILRQISELVLTLLWPPAPDPVPPGPLTITAISPPRGLPGDAILVSGTRFGGNVYRLTPSVEIFTERGW